MSLKLVLENCAQLGLYEIISSVFAGQTANFTSVGSAYSNNCTPGSSCAAPQF